MTAPDGLLLCVSPVVSRDAQHPSDEYDGGIMKKTARSRLCVGLTFTEYHALLASASDQSFAAAKSIVPDTTQSADVAAKAAFSDRIGYPA